MTDTVDSAVIIIPVIININVCPEPTGLVAPGVGPILIHSRGNITFIAVETRTLI